MQLSMQAINKIICLVMMPFDIHNYGGSIYFCPSVILFVLKKILLVEPVHHWMIIIFTNILEGLWCNSGFSALSNSKGELMLYPLHCLLTFGVCISVHIHFFDTCNFIPLLTI